MESIPPEENIDYRQENPERVRENVFDLLVQKKLLDSLFGEFEAQGFSEEEVTNIRSAYQNLDEAERNWLLAVPWELRNRQVQYLSEQVQKGKLSIEEMVQKMADVAKKKKRYIGFHASNNDVQKRMYRAGGREELSWTIEGSEADHRNDDVPMAYYSEDYEHIYRVKNPKYLYIVSYDPAPRSGHYRDSSQKWGRAPNLDIIEKVDIHQLEDEIDAVLAKEKQAELHREENKKAA